MANIILPGSLGKDLEGHGVIANVLNGKVVLHCKTHMFFYNARAQATPGCKACHMVQHVGLLATIPPERQDEILEDLEYAVHHLVEAAKKGQIDRLKLYKSPQVSIEKGPN